MKWGDANLLLPSCSCVASIVYPTYAFSPSGMSVMPLFQERILRWQYLRLDQMSLSPLAEYDDVITGPLF